MYEQQIYANNPQTIDALKHNVQKQIRRISHKCLDKVIANLNVRVAYSNLMSRSLD